MAAGFWKIGMCTFKNEFCCGSNIVVIVLKKYNHVKEAKESMLSYSYHHLLFDCYRDGETDVFAIAGKGHYISSVPC